MKTHAFERGQTLPILAVTVLVLVAVAGFAADVGYHQYQQRVQQTATDSAALAAASELVIGHADTAGKRDAASNGFTDGANNVVVTIASPAPPDPYAGDPNAIEADITAIYPTFFEKVFNIGTVTVKTKAVAIDNAPSKVCLVGLLTTGTTNIDAHSIIQAPQCDITVNNAHLSIGGQSHITTADPIQYAGALTGQGTSTFDPSAPVSTLPISDPCQSGQIPTCLALLQNPASTTPCQDGSNLSGTVSAGIYCDMVFKGDATLSDGVYIIPSNGHFNANNHTLTGSNVTIIDYASNNINAGSAVFNLSAPTSGQYANILWFAPNYTQSVTFNTGTGSLTGVMYFPRASVTMNAGSTALTVLIAGQLTLNAANTSLGPPPGFTVQVPRLVE